MRIFSAAAVDVNVFLVGQFLALKFKARALVRGEKKSFKIIKVLLSAWAHGLKYPQSPFFEQGICQLSESGGTRLQIMLNVWGARTKNSWQV